MRITKRYVISFLISVILLIFLFSRVDFQKVFDILKTANLFIFFFAISLTILSLVVKSLRWKLLLDAYKFKIKLLDVFSSFLAALFIANATPARLGEASRPYFLKRRYKTSFFSVLPSILVERSVDLFVLIIYSIIFLLLFSSMVPLILKIVILFASFLIVSMIVILFNKSISNKFINLFFRAFSFMRHISKLKPRVKKFVNKFYDGIKNLKTANFSAIIFLTLFAWFIESLILFTIASSLNVTASLLYCLGFTSLAILGGTVSFLPGGLGSTEIILFGFFVMLGYSEPISLSVTLLYRFATFGMTIFVGVIFFLREVKH